MNPNWRRRLLFLMGIIFGASNAALAVMGFVALQAAKKATLASGGTWSMGWTWTMMVATVVMTISGLFLVGLVPLPNYEPPTDAHKASDPTDPSKEQS